MDIYNDAHTARFGMPLLYSAQAQKEIFHNEALTTIDHMIAPVIEGLANDPPAGELPDGQGWLIGDDPTGEWAGHAGKLAHATKNSWRFTEPMPGMLVLDTQIGCFRIYREDGWFVPNALSSATGGNSIDIESRALLVEILALLRGFRFLPEISQ